MAEPFLEATVAGAQANSYVTLAAADAYFADTLEAAEWQEFPPEDRARALISATRKLDLECRYRGTPYDPFTPQALQFPRRGDLDAQGNPQLPPAIVYATCELALHLLRRQQRPDLFDRERLQEEGVRQVSVDGLRETYTRGVWDHFPRRVRKLLRPFILRGGSTVVE